MTSTSPRFALTIPAADGSDQADLAALLRSLGLDVENKMPGVAALTTAARTALTGAAKFAGRAVFDTGDAYFWGTDGTSWWPLAKLAADKSLPMGGQKITGLGAGTAATDAVAKGQLDAALPVGAVIAYAGPSAPAGWALCNGAALSRTGYAALFAVLGTVHGDGNGSTTFNVPDLRGRFVVGSGQGAGLTVRPAGTAGGAETHALTAEQMPAHSHGGATLGAGSHSHSVAGSTAPVGDHDHGGGFRVDGIRRVIETGSDWNTAQAIGNPVLPQGAHQHTFSVTSGPVSDHSHSIPSDGGGQAHNNMPPFYALTYIIKTS
jgi:microcystin-dependent protein